MRRILFLDVNGVLNSRFDSGADGLGESHLRQLKRIEDEAGCVIVLTSSWRLADDLTAKLMRAFDRHGIPIWIDSTPDVSGDRAEEVQVWITEHGPCVGVVIDDDYDGFEKTEIRCVQTSVDHGLTADLASEVIRAFDSK
ncbi:hypothetical protein Spb1_22140 [Planctopirus ephydatiae]|uniref:YacP-like NYN domain protein n=1 Tax=Planctopirus ephydatiae TaxID=2528019 RepID=A0A518GNS5_9PLAN|nr:hypothetical protein Spb1_22140 [Planctopirus ephydatiae]